MKQTLGVLIVVALASFAFGQGKGKPKVDPKPKPPVVEAPVVFEWKLDFIGKFRGPQGTPNAQTRDFGGKILYYFLVVEVLSKDEMILEGMRSIPYAVGSGKVTKARDEQTHKPFILRSPTKGIVDSAIIELNDSYKVIDTKKVQSTTYFVIEKTPEKK